MKNIVLLFIVSLFISKKESDIILIEHVGEIDKPIKTIVILSKPSKAYPKAYIVTENTFKILEREIRKIKCNDSISYEFGSFKVSIKGKKEFFHCYLDRKPSMELFEKLLRLEGLNENRELLDELLTTKKRITF